MKIIDCYKKSYNIFKNLRKKKSCLINRIAIDINFYLKHILNAFEKKITDIQESKKIIGFFK